MRTASVSRPASTCPARPPSHGSTARPSGSSCTPTNPTAFPNTYWYTGDNVEMAFGQGGTVITPIEQAVAYATFANGGTRYAPQVAAAIVSPSGKVVKRFAPQVAGHVNLPPSTYQPMLTGFEGAVNSAGGTAYGTPGLASFPGGVAGKTGTADTEPGKEPTGWFVGFGPISDPAVRGGLRDRSGRLRGDRLGTGGRSDLQLPGLPPGDRAGDPSRAADRAVDHPGRPLRRPLLPRTTPAGEPPSARPTGRPAHLAAALA